MLPVAKIICNCDKCDLKVGDWSRSTIRMIPPLIRAADDSKHFLHGRLGDLAHRVTRKFFHQEQPLGNLVMRQALATPFAQRGKIKRRAICQHHRGGGGFAPGCIGRADDRAFADVRLVSSGSGSIRLMNDTNNMHTATLPTAAMIATGPPRNAAQPLSPPAILSLNFGPDVTLLCEPQ
jgi:hypothetical protein